MEEGLLMGVAENIDALLVKHDITQETLARVAGISQAAVSGWRHGKKPSNSSLKKICDYFSLEPNDILSDRYGLAAQEHGECVKLPKGAIIPTVAEDAYLPLRGRVHAGDAQEPDSIEGKILVSSTIARHHPKGYFLEVEGDCMSRVYPEGCHILIDPEKEPRNGSIAVVSIDGADYVMRRLYRGANSIMLSPDSWNDSYEDIVITPEDNHTVEFVGTVVWFQSNGEMR